MKRAFLLIVFNLSFVLYNSAQFVESVYLKIESKKKYEIMNELLSADYLINKDFTGSTLFDVSFIWTAGFKFKRKYSFEFGYYMEDYFAGYMTNNPLKLNLGVLNSIDRLHHFFIKLNYDLLKYNRFILEPGIAGVYGKATYWNGFFININAGGPATDDYGNTIIIHDFNEKGIDYGLNKHYFYINLSTTISYNFSKTLDMLFCSGYNFGFKPMGYYRGYFQINNEPIQNIKNETKGKHYYFTLGLKLKIWSRKQLSNTD